MAQTLVERDSPSYLIGLSTATLGEVQLARGKREAARESFQIAVTQLDQTLGPDHPSTRRARGLAGRP
jgi:predicted negative regulator of RcsB-dependent stress response